MSNTWLKIKFLSFIITVWLNNFVLKSSFFLEISRIDNRKFYSVKIFLAAL